MPYIIFAQPTKKITSTQPHQFTILISQPAFVCNESHRLFCCIHRSYCTTPQYSVQQSRSTQLSLSCGKTNTRALYPGMSLSLHAACNTALLSGPAIAACLTKASVVICNQCLKLLILNIYATNNCELVNYEIYDKK